MSAFERWCRTEEGVTLSCLVPGCDWWKVVQWGDFAGPAPSAAVTSFEEHFAEHAQEVE